MVSENGFQEIFWFLGEKLNQAHVKKQTFSVFLKTFYLFFPLKNLIILFAPSDNFCLYLPPILRILGKDSLMSPTTHHPTSSIFHCYPIPIYHPIKILIVHLFVTATVTRSYKAVLEFISKERPKFDKLKTILRFSYSCPHVVHEYESKIIGYVAYKLSQLSRFFAVLSIYCSCKYCSN